MNENESKKLADLRKRNREIYEHSGNFEPLEMIKSGKAKRYSSKREIATVIIAVIIVAAAIAGIFGLSFAIFRVNHISVGNVADFYAEEVIAASGIKKGQNLLLLDKNEVAKNIASRIDYATQIEVKKVYPSGVTINMKTGEGKYYIKAGSFYYVLDKNCVVIAKTTNIEDVELAGCIFLQSGEIARCVLGEKLTYRDADLQGVFDELCVMFDKYGHSGFVSAIYLDSKFDIRFSYKGRYTVKLGDLFDLDIKFQFLEKIVETLSETDSGIIDISDDDIHEAIVTLY